MGERLRLAWWGLRVVAIMWAGVFGLAVFLWVSGGSVGASVMVFSAWILLTAGLDSFGFGMLQGLEKDLARRHP